MVDFTRREMLKAGLAGTGVAMALNAPAFAQEVKKKAGKGSTMKNEDFYKDGKLLGDKAKEAYYDLMKKFKVPVYKRLQTDEFWAIDFGLGEFTSVGMGGIFWVNEKEEGYFGHEIYLLPGQMIVEHSHLEVEEAKVMPKVESWQVRHGWVYGLSQGEANFATMPELKIPESQKKFLNVNHVEKWEADGFAHKLVKPKSWHFMMAGPEGAIVTEYATFHDNKGLRFANPAVKF
jgi:D-lyxose ketol-isomerase